MVKGIIVSSYHPPRSRDIVLHVRCEDGLKRRIVVRGFKPYFFIEGGNDAKSIFGQDLKRIEAEFPEQVRELRSKYFRTYEADVRYVLRWMIDAGVFGAIEFPENKLVVGLNEVKGVDVSDVDVKITISYIDIEVQPPEEGGIPDAKNPTLPVTAFTIATNKNSKYLTGLLTNRASEYEEREWKVRVYESERGLFNFLRKCFEIISPDIITGWNIDFDISYLLARARKLGLGFDLRDYGCEVFDLLHAYRRIYRQQSYALKYVAVAEGLVKEEDVKQFPDVASLYKTNPLEFARYNMNDVRLVKMIDEKHKLTNYYLHLKYLVGLDRIENTLYSSSLIDTLILREAKRRGVVLPSKTEEKESEESYEGAFVFVKSGGVFENVACFDFSSYYPTIITTLNLSPEVEEGSEEEGIIPAITHKFLKEKERITKLMKSVERGSEQYFKYYELRQAVKGIVNAVYGVMGYKGFRLYDVNVASRVTEAGREGIKAVIRFAKEKGFETLYSDTDSIFIQIPFEKCEEFAEEATDYINKIFNCKEKRFTFEFDKYFAKIFFKGVKKRYAARVVWDGGKECDYVLIRGFESVRTDTPKFTKTLMEDMFKIILYSKDRKEMVKELKEYVSECIKNFRKAPLEEVAIPTRLTKPPDQYKTLSANLRGILNAKRILNINGSESDRWLLLWVKMVNRQPCDVICFPQGFDFSKVDIVVDWRRMEERCIVRKVSEIFAPLGLSVSGEAQTKLL